MKTPKLTRADAEEIAVGALRFLAEEPERIGRFLALSGMTPADLREAADTTAFLQAVLNHMLGDESLLLVFASQARLPPERVGLAEQLLATYP